MRVVPAPAPGPGAPQAGHPRDVRGPPRAGPGPNSNRTWYCGRAVANTTACLEVVTAAGQHIPGCNVCIIRVYPIIISNTGAGVLVKVWPYYLNSVFPPVPGPVPVGVIRYQGPRVQE